MNESRKSRVESRALGSDALGVVTRELKPSTRAPRPTNGFTLVEVMVALGVFFMALFTILGLVSNSLRNARALQRKQVDCGQVAAQVYFRLSNTNQVDEGVESGDFGDMYPDYDWTTDSYEVATNGLYRVDMIVQRRSGGTVESKMSILIFPQNAKPGSLDQGGLK